MLMLGRGILVCGRSFPEIGSKQSQTLTPKREDDVVATGAILLKCLSIAWLQAIAEILTKNVVLAHHEDTACQRV